MQINDVYKSLGKSILDEYEDELSVFLGKAINAYLSAERQEVVNNIDIVDVIRGYLDKKLFYVDIGDLPKEKAQEISKSLINQIKEEQSFKNKLNKYVDKISQQERANSISITDVIDSQQNNNTLFSFPQNLKFAEAVAVKPTYDVHHILNNKKEYNDQPEEVKKFVEDNWYSKDRLDDEFHNLPKLGEENPIDLYNSIIETDDNGQISGNVDL